MPITHMGELSRAACGAHLSVALGRPPCRGIARRLMLPVSKDTLLRVADWMPIRGPYCWPLDIQNGRVSAADLIGAGSRPAHAHAIAVKHGRA
jgi:hypothetical protein